MKQIMQVVFPTSTPYKQSLFLGGSITGAADWQTDFTKRFEIIASGDDRRYKLKTDLTVFNPRRENFDVSNRRMEYEQIEWEYRHLRIADAVLFWFAKETNAPITLFELGRHSLIAGRPIFIGCDPEYPRIRDVKIQMDLINPNYRIRHSVVQLVDDVWNWLVNREFEEQARENGDFGYV